MNKLISTPNINTTVKPIQQSNNAIYPTNNHLSKVLSNDDINIKNITISQPAQNNNVVFPKINKELPQLIKINLLDVKLKNSVVYLADLNKYFEDGAIYNINIQIGLKTNSKTFLNHYQFGITDKTNMKMKFETEIYNSMIDKEITISKNISVLYQHSKTDENKIFLNLNSSSGDIQIDYNHSYINCLKY